MRVYIKYKDIPNRNDIKSNFIGILKITIEEEKVDQLDEKYNNAVPDFKATIKKAIEDGAKTVDDIKEMTEASTGCGGCEDEIQEILDELLK